MQLCAGVFSSGLYCAKLLDIRSGSRYYFSNFQADSISIGDNSAVSDSQFSNFKVTSGEYALSGRTVWIRSSSSNLRFLHGDFEPSALTTFYIQSTGVPTNIWLEDIQDSPTGGAASVTNGGTGAVYYGACRFGGAVQGNVQTLKFYSNITAPTINAISGFQANGTPGVTHAASTVTTITLSEGIVTGFTGSSDERLKTAIEPLTLGLDAIEAIEPVFFRWSEKGAKHGGCDPSIVHVGFVAQNVQKAIPQAITGTEPSKDGKEKYLVAEDRAVMATLVNAVKQLSAENKLLRESIAKLERKAASTI